MTPDIFRECRERVTARAAAEFYGYHPNRAGFIVCPFHNEKSPSLKLYGNGTFHCFGCGAGSSSIDFVRRLYGLEPLEAVKRLDVDFHLGLEINKPIPPAERREAAVEARRRQELTDTHNAFEGWRRDTVQQLNEVFRLAHLTMNRLDGPEALTKLTDGEAEAIRWQAWAESVGNTLNSGTMAEQMEIFRDRKEVTARCSKILNNLPKRSSVV